MAAGFPGRRRLPVPVAWPGAEVGYLKHRLHSRHHVQDTLGTIAGTRTFNCKRHVKVDNIESGTQTAELILGTDIIDI